MPEDLVRVCAQMRLRLLMMQDSQNYEVHTSTDTCLLECCHTIINAIKIRKMDMI
jgi:hypothetical protein